MPSVPPVSAAPPPDQSKADVLTVGGVAPALSNGAVVWRLLKLTGVIAGTACCYLSCKLLLMGLSVSMVQFGGYGIDLIRFHTGQMTELPVFSRLSRFRRLIHHWLKSASRLQAWRSWRCCEPE